MATRINSNLEREALRTMLRPDGSTFVFNDDFKLKVIHHGSYSRTLRVERLGDTPWAIIIDAQKCGIWYISDVSSSFRLNEGLQDLLVKACRDWK